MRFNAQMNLSNLNVRREKAGDGPGDIAADLKLTGKVHVGDLKDLFLTDHGFAVITGMFDADGNLRSQDFDDFRLTRELTGVKARLSTALGTPLDFDLANADSFAVELQINNTALVSLRLQVHPTDEQISALAELLMSDVTVVLEQVQGELKLAGGTDVPGEAAAKTHIGGPA